MKAIAGGERVTFSTGKCVITDQMLAHSVRESRLLRTVHIRSAGCCIAMAVGTADRKSCRVAASAVGRCACCGRIATGVCIIMTTAALGDIGTADSHMQSTGVYGRVSWFSRSWRFEDPVYMQGLIYKDSGIAVAGAVDIRMATAGVADGRARETGRNADACRMA